jgi:transcriptional regulator GlxA family with amidase domain
MTAQAQMPERSSIGTGFERPCPVDQRIAAVIERMEQEIQRPLRVAELAARVNLSASRLMHLFRAETGVPPARYLRELRLRRARAELEQTFLSVKEIMFAFGFTDPSHFSRTFKRRYGVSPAAVRPRAARERRRAGARKPESGEQPERPRVSRIGPQSRGTADDRSLLQ